MQGSEAVRVQGSEAGLGGGPGAGSGSGLQGLEAVRMQGLESGGGPDRARRWLILGGENNAQIEASGRVSDFSGDSRVR